MRETKKANSAKTIEKRIDSQVKNYFMFDEDESKVGDNTDNSSTVSQKSKTIEFCTDKPYRLALYVHPSTRRRVDPSDSKVLANLTLMRQNQDKENNKKHKRGRTKGEKENAVTLFEENDTSKCQKKVRKLDDETPAEGEKPVKIAKKGILSFLNMNESVQKKMENEEDHLFLSKAKEKRICRSYVKKSKASADLENLVESPLEKAVNEKETKKRTKSKVKKEDKKETNEDEEYEKWAESINSDFEDIDKFELSITYD